jgi:hypothetical protein
MKARHSLYSRLLCSFSRWLEPSDAICVKPEGVPDSFAHRLEVEQNRQETGVDRRERRLVTREVRETTAGGLEEDLHRNDAFSIRRIYQQEA